MSETLVEFLRARLDEDEQTARMGAQLHDDEPADPSYADGVADLESAGWEPEAARRFNAYVARFDPARVLREVAAKRRIVATYTELDAHPNRLSYAFIQQQWVALRAVIAALALPYSDHLSYRPEWAPDLA